jgi:carbon monoxide dehydrogenase subunit G
MLAPTAPRRLLLATTLLALATGLLPTAAWAHGPTRQKVTEQISIDAPAAAVWARIRNFDALKDWHPAVASSSASDGNNEGSLRTLQLRGGGTVQEALETHDDSKMRYSYRIKQAGPLPVTNYASTLTVKPDGEQRCTVEWRGAFYRGYPNNDPPPEQNDEAAVRAITGVYTAGLAQLKKLAEAR